jgi:hypothetical protein
MSTVEIPKTDESADLQVAQSFLNRLLTLGGCIICVEDADASASIDSDDLFVSPNGLMFARVDFSPAEQSTDDPYQLSIFDDLPVLKALELIDEDFEEFRTDFLVG